MASRGSDTRCCERRLRPMMATRTRAYGRVPGVISECGEALIMNGYLAPGELVHILKDSNASRFLVGSKLKEAA